MQHLSKPAVKLSSWIMLMALVVIFTNSRPLNMDKHLFSDLIAYSIIALFVLGFISLSLTLFNTAMLHFSFALIALGVYTINKTL
jgi:hypothetical protein